MARTQSTLTKDILKLAKAGKKNKYIAEKLGCEYYQVVNAKSAENRRLKKAAQKAKPVAKPKAKAAPVQEAVAKPETTPITIEFDTSKTPTGLGFWGRIRFLLRGW